MAASGKMGVIAAGVYSGIKTWYNSTGTNKERFVKSIVSGAVTIAGGFAGDGITKCFRWTVTSEFLWGHALTDINIGSATTVITEAGKSLVTRSFAEDFCGFIDRTGLTLYRMEGIA